MIKQKKVITKIELNPKHIDSNIMNHLLETSRKDIVNTCSEKHGYIITVDSIDKIIDNTNTLFRLSLNASVLHLESGDVANGKVCMLYKDGIFAIILNKQRVLIPKKHLEEDYEYDPKQNIYISKNDSNQMIKEGQEIHIEIVHTMYSNQTMRCIGKLLKDRKV